MWQQAKAELWQELKEKPDFLYEDKRPLQIVNDRQQIAEKILALQANTFLALLTDPLAGILAVGQNSQVLVLQGGKFLARFSQLLLQLIGARGVHRLLR